MFQFGHIFSPRSKYQKECGPWRRGGLWFYGVFVPISTVYGFYQHYTFPGVMLWFPIKMASIPHFFLPSVLQQFSLHLCCILPCLVASLLVCCLSLMSVSGLSRTIHDRQTYSAPDIIINTNIPALSGAARLEGVLGGISANSTSKRTVQSPIQVLFPTIAS
ncbi:hypothetical protein VTK73DRAFT_10187 [Phialemonium thermophilum]|uniref:Uncharacterized protein n=1 Tax=Phialemonium thermophilum TaxID=223376 RepID=A0ABR3XH62_9PEZI